MFNSGVKRDDWCWYEKNSNFLGVSHNMTGLQWADLAELDEVLHVMKNKSVASILHGFMSNRSTWPCSLRLVTVNGRTTTPEVLVFLYFSTHLFVHPC